MRRRKASRLPIAAEVGLWILAVALLSPLVIYARPGVMPLAALFGVGGGIALCLVLVGRRLHDALLSDVLSGRPGTGKFLLTVGMMLLIVFLVLLGVAVALVLILRRGSPSLPV